MQYGRYKIVMSDSATESRMTYAALLSLGNIIVNALIASVRYFFFPILPFFPTCYTAYQSVSSVLEGSSTLAAIPATLFGPQVAIIYVFIGPFAAVMYMSVKMTIRIR